MAGKYKFTQVERFAVWDGNGRRCWLCEEPLSLRDTTIDHVLPEMLAYEEDSRRTVLNEYGLPDDFAINSYSNWLPCHHICNQRKGARPLRNSAGTQLILDGLANRAPKIAAKARAVISNATKDKVFSTLFAALERRTITIRDIDDLLSAFVTDPAKVGLPADSIFLDTGHWVPRDEIVREAYCHCDRAACVDHDQKVYCYFEASLPKWVVGTALYWKCYDEIVWCKRCATQHKRGHVGRVGTCRKPYRDQENQTD